jgi:hypothetical protein
MNHIWPSKNVMKSSKNFRTKDREYQYDMLGLSDKEREAIAISKQKRLERKAKSKQTN